MPIGGMWKTRESDVDYFTEAATGADGVFVATDLVGSCLISCHVEIPTELIKEKDVLVRCLCVIGHCATFCL